MNVGRGVDRLQRPTHGRLEFADHAEGHGDPTQVLEESADGPLAESPDATEVRSRGGQPRAEPTRGGHRRCGGEGGTTGTPEGVSAVVGDVPQLDWQFDHLVDDRFGVVPGDGGVARAAVGPLVVEDLVRGQDHTLVLGVSRLPATPFARRRLGWCGLDVRPVG